jgi:hypothetical protein
MIIGDILLGQLSWVSQVSNILIRVCMNWVKSVYLGSECIYIYIGIEMHNNLVYIYIYIGIEIHNNLVGPFR